jgi:hypothetical protein
MERTIFFKKRLAEIVKQFIVFLLPIRSHMVHESIYIGIEKTLKISMIEQ